MEISLGQTTQEEGEAVERRLYTPREYGDKMMHRLRSMKRMIEQKARIPQWTLQQVEATEVEVRLGIDCNYFPTELEKRLISLALMLDQSDQKGMKEWTKEVRGWIQEWREIYEEWKKMG
jgi:hypothetical protein